MEPRTSPSPVWTKIEPAASRPRLHRPALVRMLAEAADCRLAVIRAPAGWGKSMLLADWFGAEAGSRRFAWLALDESDNDPARFWADLAQALRRVDPDFGSVALGLVASPGVDIRRHVLPLLVNELATWSGPAVLVVDDYHVIAEPEITAAFAYLIERLPPGIQVALASRTRPALPLARLRARGELLELDASHLALSLDEASALVNDLHRMDLDDDLVTRLWARTEGWAAGIYLAVLSLRGRRGSSAREFVDGFAGTDALVIELLRSEAFAGHPAAEQQFLRRTAILQRMCASLCDAVTGSKDAAAVLADLEQSNLFLSPLDTRGAWYRYHQLFADVLRAELERTEPDMIVELHRRAAGWFTDAGEVTAAVRHLVAAGDRTEAGELVARHWSPHVQANLDATVAGWLRVLGDPVVAADARLCVAAATTALSMHRDLEAAAWIEAIEQAAPAGPFFDGFSTPAAAAATMRAIRNMTRGDSRATLAAAVDAARLERRSSPWHAVAVDVGGIALRWLGRAEDSRRHLSAAVAASRAAGVQVMPVVYGLGHLAGLAADRHDWLDADQHAADALQVAATNGTGEHWVCGMAHLVRGRVMAETGRLDLALPVLRRGIELAERGAGPLDVAWGLLATAAVCHARGDAAEAAQAAEKARATLEACADPGPLLSDLLSAITRRLGSGDRSRRSTAELSAREQQILALLPTDLTQRQIGLELHLSANTVKSHIASIFRKLGVSARADAVTAARERGLACRPRWS